VKSRTANGGSPPTADAGAGIPGSEPQNTAERLSPIPSKSSRAHPPAFASEEERQLDYSLRPRSLAEFVGQERIRKVLAMSIEAARKRGETLDHILFSAPPGLGKTSLAHKPAVGTGGNTSPPGLGASNLLHRGQSSPQSQPAHRYILPCRPLNVQVSEHRWPRSIGPSYPDGKIPLLRN
jgi:hypothetical protein